ncbi:BTAD domain-containing putative transcriptional regulator [Amycolatopsis sp. WGS_07]|uniref:AfsR/SARP family transcriptional regulator n=1 Tax=Amycolatopsis sp. WGS_07 TaxID=3076764 RepID=UPI003872AD7A
MESRVLGPLRLIHNERDITPHAPKIRPVLALLLMHAKQVVGVDTIVEELWQENPPRSAVTTAQTYIYQMRKTFISELGRKAGELVIRTIPPGYVFGGENDLDVTLFDQLVTEAQRFRAAGRPEECANRARRALSLWSGPALANVEKGELLRNFATHLEDKRLMALELRIEAEMQLGRHRELVSELRTLVALHPFNEWFHSQLITALNAGGRRYEALEAYRQVRILLADELGLTPSIALQRLHQDILVNGMRDDSPLAPPGRRTIERLETSAHPRRPQFRQACTK